MFVSGFLFLRNTIIFISESCTCAASNQYIGMTFNSLQFLVFFLVVTLMFFRLQHQKMRMLLLLVASCYFYMSFIPEYLLILGGTIVVDYFAGLQIERSEGRSRRWWLIVSLVANIGVLAVFKYYNFFIDAVSSGAGLFGKPLSLPLLQIALPVGLSFHTFQAMSYTIEVYRRNQPAERNFITYALYVMFYPQLVAGPIERPQNILPQLKEYRPYNWDNVKEGLSQMLWGFFKKVVVADRLSMAVDHTYNYVDGHSSPALWIGAVFYSFQIYCDFSGYSDIAIGAAKVMNIQLMTNFNQPYLAKNMSEFWSRWHISLSSWFRDYVYIPLGGNRRGNGRRLFNILLVFMLSGLWHGANYTFIVWGLLHGLLVALSQRKEKGAGKGRSVLFNGISIAVNFMLVTVLWVFFRSASIAAAGKYIKRMFNFKAGENYLGVDKVEVIFSVALIGIVMLREYLLTKHFISKDKYFYLYTIMMVLVCYYFGVFIENHFIYFQF